mmetsp:Transcript_23032/g.38068  ORF Transcript_23032/g.38068 Transcript_23032/m.38068 type:complete len:658 (-) Transcript_23032:243-2216(-)|eukprot:CAMPEP_0119006628 /NCGR_PEP_ID=MMETSP1176-20130426/2424_1 /TAXON_ID=265551 /ORGANISM="Synedropsis recta cf, Strain CCMP1620" /LENGTH=657 /DNA_ID=CAMNT_0006958579 /DNA_START=55 /DNA_END=2028 /DNA_ORIENTATION=-
MNADYAAVIAAFFLLHAIVTAQELQTLPSCPLYTEFTSSDVVVEFFGCPLGLDQVDLDILSVKFLQTYNRINAFDSNDLCDAFFRQIVSVQAVLDPNFNVDFDRRELKEEESEEEQEEWDEDESGNESDDEDVNEGSNAAVNKAIKVVVNEDSNESGNGDESVESRTGSSVEQCPGSFEIRFQIVARCRGCDLNTVTLFDEEEDVNFFEGFDEDRRLQDQDAQVFHPLLRSHSRKLQRNLCQCPIDPKYRAVTEKEMEKAYDEVLEKGFNLGIGLPQLSVKDVIEIEQVTCAPMKNNFETTIDLSFGTDSIDNTVPPEILDALSQSFQMSYNSLTERFCDPFFRQVEAIQVLKHGVTPARQLRPTPFFRPSFLANFTSTFTFNFVFTFTFFLTGVCRGCPPKSLLFDDAARRRSLMTHNELTRAPPQHGRFLQQSNAQESATCYCAAVNFVDGAPTEREFSERYNHDVQLLSALAGNQYTIAALNEQVDSTVVTTSPRTALQCNSAAECVASKEGSVCINNECLHDGNPRFTLTWTGDDDLDLSVITPFGTKVWYQHNFDATTNGAFDTGYVQDVYGSHVESVYFPVGPEGKYRILVSQYKEQGEGDDEWVLEVVVNGMIAMQLNGKGAEFDEEEGGIIYHHGGQQEQQVAADDPWN